MIFLKNAYPELILTQNVFFMFFKFLEVIHAFSIKKGLFFTVFVFLFLSGAKKISPYMHVKYENFGKF